MMLKDRLIWGVFFAAVFLGVVLTPGWVGAGLFTLALMALIVVALKEGAALLQKVGLESYKELLYVFAVLLIGVLFLAGVFVQYFGSAALNYQGGQDFHRLFELFKFSFPFELTLLCLFTIFGLREIVREKDLAVGVRKMAGSLALLLFIYGSLGLVPRLYFAYGLTTGGHFVLLFIVVVAKSADVGAYLMGTFSSKWPGGNHKLSLRLSPKKSLEGLIGGVLFSTFMAGVLAWAMHRYLALDSFLPVRVAALFGGGCAILGFFSDIGVSALKRGADVKDSGQLPGLGGALDILDSLLLTLPAYFVLLWFFATT